MFYKFLYDYISLPDFVDRPNMCPRTLAITIPLFYQWLIDLLWRFGLRWHTACKVKSQTTDRERKENDMGWVISVGEAGVKGRQSRTQVGALTLSVDVEGATARLKVYPDGHMGAESGAGAVPAWQAQRVWQNVLSTLVGH
jgi:hypothetical protein